jgi:hypothetical protein
MNALPKGPGKTDTDRYARCISASKRVRWDIDYDVIRGRRFDRSQKFLPDGLLACPPAWCHGLVYIRSALAEGMIRP